MIRESPRRMAPSRRRRSAHSHFVTSGPGCSNLPAMFKRLCLIASALVFSAGIPLRAGEPAKEKPRNVAEVANSIRLRQLTTRLELTEDQQNKIKVLFAAEAEKVAKVDAMGLPLNERTMKVTALKKETQDNIRPLLTPVQVEKLDQQNKQLEKRKKKA